jgi:hypothetical protein
VEEIVVCLLLMKKILCIWVVRGKWIEVGVGKHIWGKFSETWWHGFRSRFGNWGDEFWYRGHGMMRKVWWSGKGNSLGVWWWCIGDG